MEYTGEGIHLVQGDKGRRDKMWNYPEKSKVLKRAALSLGELAIG